MTVFLTTQYLEEADILADRIGIIDHGSIVAEGTPAQLKAEIGSPSVEVTPTDPDAGDRLGELLAGFGETRRNGHGSVTVQLPGGEAELAEIVRDSRSRRSARPDPPAPPALARRRVPGQDRSQARGIGRRRRS